MAESGRHVGIEYLAFLDSRIMQIMNPEDVRAITQEGIDATRATNTA
jgi:hypothetical protein